MVASTQRFMRKGISKFYFLTSIASATAILATEVNAGVDVTPQLDTINGFSFTNTPIKVPDMSNTYASEIAGEDTSPNSSLDFYELRGGTTDAIHDAFVKNATGYIVIAFRGIAGAAPAIGDTVDAWPVIVSSNSHHYSAGNEAAKYMVTYSMTAPVRSNVALT